MTTIDIQGTDVTEFTPLAGVIPLAGIRSPNQAVCIRWEVDGASGSTECEAWRGQHEIDCLQRAGYAIKNVSIC